MTLEPRRKAAVPGNRFSSLSCILSAPSGRLQALRRRAARLESLTQALRAALPEDLAPHVQVANLRGDTVVLAADSPAWLTLLRLQAPQVLRRLRALPGMGALRTLRMRVLAAPAGAPAAAPRRAGLSAAAGRHLRQAADALGDPALARALVRLARHAPDG